MSAEQEGRGPESEGLEPGADDAIIIQAKELFQGRREVWIEQGEEMYRLRLTPSGKLYLTK